MFRISADNLEQYFTADRQREGDLRKLDDFIRQTAPALKSWFYNVDGDDQPGMRFKMIGYGKFAYQNRRGETINWPVIGVALQKNYISVYLSATRNDRPILDYYKGKLNERRSGLNNFSFRTFAELDREPFKNLVREIAELAATDKQNFIDFKSAPKHPE